MTEEHGTLSVEEAAARLGISGQTIRRRIKAGKIEATLVHGPKGKEWRLLRVGELADAEQEESVAIAMPLVRAEDIGQFLQLLREDREQIATLHEEVTRLREELASRDATQKALSAPKGKRPWWKVW